MATFSTADLDLTDRYRLLSGLVVPRPIGWVGTVDHDGRPNLAPYSFFQAVATNPPTVMFSAVTRGGHEKDSLLNVRLTGEFTCSLVDMAVKDSMNLSSAPLGRGESEFDFAGLTPEPSIDVKAPRVAEAKASLECRVIQITELGEDPSRNTVVFGEVVRFHASDAVLDGHRINLAALDAVGRMDGNDYTSTRDRFELLRPR